MRAASNAEATCIADRENTNDKKGKYGPWRAQAWKQVDLREVMMIQKRHMNNVGKAYRQRHPVSARYGSLLVCL